MATLVRERALWQQGCQWVAGVDEAGRGPLAGPVVAAAVILPPGFQGLAGLTDSKQLNARQREALLPQIQELALDYALGVVTAPVIDRINILQATRLAMWRALCGLRQVDRALIDGNQPVPLWEGPQESIVKGDAQVLSIAAASVLAKVSRDRMMQALAQHYPGYGFERHMGYPTSAHRQAVRQLGLSPQHRRSFCRKLLESAA